MKTKYLIFNLMLLLLLSACNNTVSGNELVSDNETVSEDLNVSDNDAVSDDSLSDNEVEATGIIIEQNEIPAAYEEVIGSCFTLGYDSEVWSPIYSNHEGAFDDYELNLGAINEYTADVIVATKDMKSKGELNSEEMSDKFKKSLDAISDMTFISCEDVLLGDAKGVKLELSQSVNGVQELASEYYFWYGNKQLVISFSIAADKYEAFEAEFLNILATLKLYY